MGIEQINFSDYAPGQLVQEKLLNGESKDIEIRGFKTLSELRIYSLNLLQSLINADSKREFFHKINEGALVYIITKYD